MSALVLLLDFVTEAYRRRRYCQEDLGQLELVRCWASDGTVTAAYCIPVEANNGY